ncbi:hypothetical protein TVAG_266550 [Trichomonas vaginalis G3]|uniref:DUF3447 domain-containing protein n=1 Tax=Trichomonas vaginalis (strain ATCC PRA-98 / G3) TaxID=412133 RepID=A2DQK8_TRIV3|nr:protein ubiquitination [Trichomonas vaginalis G3]EAY17292.1 hypothetical protein TVAG_266550 [Trichomonas vaginalis G3]KAI5523293.1 protein ubiquitination [Trichomonas vaginalis G3]|eukprot:XP_001329515.1 hypothetical protein [Trichomonas vaginalis G3]
MNYHFKETKIHRELKNICKYYIDSYNALYQLKTNNEEEIKSIYNKIKTELIETNKQLPRNVIKNILHIIPFNNRCTKSYLSLAKFIYDDYHIKEVKDLSLVTNYLFYKEYGIKLHKTDDFKKIQTKNLDLLSNDTIYRAIMNNDTERLIKFTESGNFYVKNQRIKSKLYPFSENGYSLLELCCYYGSFDCFKFLRTKFKSEITQRCLNLSYLGRNQAIISECLNNEWPDEESLEYAIISHNINFVTYVMKENNFNIDVECCGQYHNIEAFLIYFDLTNDANQCFFESTMFDVPHLTE